MTELCIDFGGTSVKIGLLSSGDVLTSREIPVADDMLAITAEAARGLTDRAAVDPTSVGVSLPGIVDRATGQLIRAHGKHASLAGIDLRNWAETTFGLPADIENDARAALLGETRHGCAIGTENAVIVTLGTGIGTAALLDGMLVRGAHDHAGVLGGHVTVDVNGERCPCGNIGCAETLASAWALQRRLKSHPEYSTSALAGPHPSTLKNLVLAAAALDRVATDTLGDFIRIWGAAIVTLCHMYDPEIVVVSGGVMRSRDAILPRLTSYVHDHLWSSSYRPELRTPNSPELSVLRGLSVIARNAAAAEKAPNTRSSANVEQ